jgi:hypothetical protein
VQAVIVTQVNAAQAEQPAIDEDAQPEAEQPAQPKRSRRKQAA